MLFTARDPGPLRSEAHHTPVPDRIAVPVSRAVCPLIPNQVAHTHGVRRHPSGTSRSSIAYRLLYTVTEQLPTWAYRVLQVLCVFFSMGVFYHQAGDFMTITKKNYRFGFLFYMPAAPSGCPTLPTLPANRKLAERNLAATAGPTTVCHPGHRFRTAKKNPHRVAMMGVHPFKGGRKNSVYVPGLIQVCSANC